MSLSSVTVFVIFSIISVSNSQRVSLICRGGSSRGSCSADVPRFYYNEQKNACEQFSWSGCGGNENNFVAKQSCESRCVQKPKIPLKDHPKFKKCFLKPDGGIGRALFKKYYYDRNSRRCKEFDYGGMYGNENRFDSLDECYEECASKVNPYLQLVKN